MISVFSKISGLLKQGVKPCEISIITPVIDKMLKFSLREFLKTNILPLYLSGSEKLIQNRLVQATIVILKLNTDLRRTLTSFDIKVILSCILNIPIKYCEEILENFDRTKQLIAFDFEDEEYDKKYKNIIENQLGNVIIVDSLDDANKIGKKIDYKYKIVSLEGDILYSGGAVSGGTINTNNDDKLNLLHMQNEYNDKKGLLQSISVTLDNANDKYEELEKEISEINYKLTEKRVLIENKERVLSETKDKLTYTESNIDGFKNLNNNTLNDKIEEILYTLNSKSKEKEILENNLISLKSRKFDLNNKIEDLERKINEVNSKYNKNESLIKNNEIEIGKLEVKMDALLDNLQNEYNMTYENALKSYELTMDPEEAREIVIKYKNDLKGLTNINIGSISEYDRLSKRYDFLAGQKDDLEASSKELYNIIDEMDDIMKKRFKETFDKISTEYSIVFRKMFKGGNGVLKLIDENDLLNTGISILAVPPGKKLNSTSMLSGGEKALTAICLIFAILNVKPAPFIVLDEVEAPLDEENVSMFGDYLKSMQNISQFILITHKKKMMEYASNLYGVTMQESGVSKLVSVKLENNIE